MLLGMQDVPNTTHYVSLLHVIGTSMQLLSEAANSNQGKAKVCSMLLAGGS